MSSFDDLAVLADTSAFIFTGSITRASASTVPGLPVEATTVLVSVEDAIKIPAGLRSFAGREVTVQLRHPLATGHYVFFADPLAVGEGIAVKERAHLDGRERGGVGGSEPRLCCPDDAAPGGGIPGGVGHRGRSPPSPLTCGPARGGVPWAVAPFEIERVLKGKGKLRHVTLIGPLHASKLLPRAPALRAGLHAILILQRPPQEAIECVADDERQAMAFIADTSDIQPPERIATLERIISGTEKE